MASLTISYLDKMGVVICGEVFYLYEAINYLREELDILLQKLINN